MAGLLLVTMQPKDGLELDEFNDWYNNEHGPQRLRLPFIKTGYRYRATDLQMESGKGKPEWIAIYDVTDMSELTKETYTSLRLPENKSQREIEVMKKIDVGRQLFDLMSSYQSEEFHELDSVDSIGEGSALVVAQVTLHPEWGTEDEMREWFNQEHAFDISKIRGWRRSRLYKTSGFAEGQELKFMGLHEFKPDNDLTPELMAEVAGTPWSLRVRDIVTNSHSRRMAQLYHTFKAAPSYLESTHDFVSKDGLTKSEKGHALESFITTKDGIKLQYRLEGAPEENAPLVVLSNCILTNWGIWDAFVQDFLAKNPKYRVLRYNSRGRTSETGSEPITLDTLSEDIIALLDALRVPDAILIGDSLGGATALNTAVKHRTRVSKFISCDTNSVSPASNRDAWTERLALAEKDAKSSSDSSDLVGPTLAEATAKRWFADASHPEFQRVQEMVRTNSLSGFKQAVNALFDYDLTSWLGTSTRKGCFIVGAQDGQLPETMKKLAAAYGADLVEQGKYAVVDHAGHLPMVEQPEVFSGIVSRFLAGEETLEVRN